MWYCFPHPSWSKKGYFSGRALRFLNLPKSLCPLMCLVASCGVRKLPGKPWLHDSSWIPCLQLLYVWHHEVIVDEPSGQLLCLTSLRSVIVITEIVSLNHTLCCITGIIPCWLYVWQCYHDVLQASVLNNFSQRTSRGVMYFWSRQPSYIRALSLLLLNYF